VAATDTLAPGLRLADRYTLQRPLGRGGMAQVWEAENEAGQRVAVKMLSAPGGASDDLVKRFWLEAKASNVISHPGVVRVIDSGATPWGAPFLVMERLVGASLEDVAAANGPLSAAQATGVLVPLLDALSAAHQAGVVHRDLKPGNVFVAVAPSPVVKLLDFGISRVLTDDARLTQTGMLFGTPAYMAPEQVKDPRLAGVQADLYSAGALAFELLTGRLPFLGDSPLAIAAKALTETPPALSTLRPDLPAALCRLVDQCLEKSPMLRPQSAHALRDHLRAAATPDSAWVFSAALALTQEAPTPAAPSPAPTRAPRPARAQEVSLGLLLEKLPAGRRQLAPAVAARLVSDLLLDPETPVVVAPAQVLLTPEGSVRAAPGTPPLLRRGTSVRSYAAPETWKGSRTPASGQFSLGALLYELVAGRALFEGSDEAGVQAALVSGAVPPLPPEVPAALHGVLVRMVSVEPSHRFPDSGAAARELAAVFRSAPGWTRAAEELAAFRRGALAAATAPVTSVEPRTSSAGVSLGTGLLVIGLALAVVAGVGWSRAEKEPVEPAPEPEVPSTLVPGGLTEAPPAVPAAPASWRLDSEPPGAALWIDGEFQGSAPGTLTLPPGRSYAVEARLPGHVPARQEFTPSAGEERSSTLRLAATGEPLAVLRLEVPDDVVLLVDGAPVARGGRDLPVPAGRSLSLQLQTAGGRTAPQAVRFEEGEVRTFSSAP
jgi:serine/threonine protein kinase